MTEHTNTSNVKIPTTNHVYLDNFKYYTIHRRDYGKSVRNYNLPKSLRNSIICYDLSFLFYY